MHLSHHKMSTDSIQFSSWVSGRGRHDDIISLPDSGYQNTKGLRSQSIGKVNQRIIQKITIEKLDNTGIGYLLPDQMIRIATGEASSEISSCDKLGTNIGLFVDSLMLVAVSYCRHT